MTNKTTKSALLMSALALLLCIAMLTGTTFAWFTDSVASDVNKIVAGNLDVELRYSKDAENWASVQGKDNIFDPNALWEPGRVEVVYLEVSNLGSLALKYQLGVNVSNETPGTNVKGETFKLSDYLVFSVVELDEIKAYGTRAAAIAATAGTEKGLKDYNGTTTTLGAKSDTETGIDYLALIVYMPETVGNEANYKTGTTAPSIELGINLFATQVESESDSFGSDYDDDAWGKGFKVLSADDLQDALNNALPGDTVTLMDDVKADAPIVISASGITTYALRSNGITLDLNGYALTANIIVEAGATAEIVNGALKNANSDDSAIETMGNLTLDNVAITTDRHAVHVEGGLTVVKGGTYLTSGFAGRTQYALYVTDGGEAIVYDGTFVGPKGTAADSGSAVGVKAGSKATIYGGSFSGGKNKTLAGSGTIVVYGGSFDQDPTAFLAEGLNAIKHDNGVYYTTGIDADLYIANVNDLKAFADSVNAGNNYSRKVVALVADIDLEGATWTPVGVASNKGFSGTFDGNGHTISDFVLSASSGKYGAGFFGNLLGGAVIKNVNFDSVSYAVRSNIVGVVAGYLYGSGTFGNINVTNADIQSFGKVGGILGMAADPGAHTVTLTNCSVEGCIGGAYNVGGLIGLVLQGQTVNLTDCETDVVFYMNDGGYNMSYVQNDAGWMWAYNNGQVYYAGVAEQYCYYNATEDEFCEGEPKELYFVATDASSLQALVNSTGSNVNIVLAGDITGDVTVAQKPDVKVTIDGNGYNFDGTLLVDGKSATYTTAGVTIKNVKFVGATADACIQLGKDNATRYTCNVTIEGCTFDADGKVGVKSYTGGDKNLTITGCTATAKAHSLIQAKGIDRITIANCEVNSKNGMNFNNSDNVSVIGCNVDVKGYAVRFGEGSAATGDTETYEIKDCSLKSANDDGDATIILRGSADKATLNIVNTTIVGTPDIANNAANATVNK